VNRRYGIWIEYFYRSVPACMLQCQCRTHATVAVGITTLPRLVIADDPIDDLDQGQGLHPVDLPSPLSQHSDVSTDVHALTPSTTTTSALQPVEMLPNHT